MTSPVERLESLAYDFGVRDLCSIVLKDYRFSVWSGSSKPLQHHYGKGGLAKHTLEVAELCLLNNKYLPTNEQVNPCQLFIAAVFHDAGKMWDYQQPNAECQDWTSTAHKRHIHHISRSALVWYESCILNSHLKLSEEYINDILHAILAHHGRREFGSPVAPNTRLAWMLHLCDGISARMNDAEKWDRIKDTHESS